MESAEITKAAEISVGSIDKSPPEPVVTSESFEPAGKKESSSSDKFLQSPPSNRDFHQNLTD